MQSSQKKSVLGTFFSSILEIFLFSFSFELNNNNNNKDKNRDLNLNMSLFSYLKFSSKYQVFSTYMGKYNG